MGSTNTQDSESDILIASADDFDEISGIDERSKTKKVNSKIIQVSKFKNIAQKFTVYNDKYIKVECNRLMKKNKYNVDLTWLNASPKKQLIISWRWLATVGVFAAMATVLIYAPAGMTAKLLDESQLFTTTAIIITLSALSFFIFLYRSRYLARFETWHGRIPLFELLINKPNKKEFNAFLDDLKQRIDNLHAKVKKDGANTLAKELKEHRVL